MIDREELIKVLNDYFTIGDSDTYVLTRVKEGFALGTVTIDDFQEFDESNVADLADYVIKHTSKASVEPKTKRQRRVRLKNCPIGLFKYDGTICLKTEYSLDECYTVEGGEVFWGDGSKTRETKGDFLVTPTSIEQLQRQTAKEIFQDLYNQANNQWQVIEWTTEDIEQQAKKHGVEIKQ